MHIPAEWMRDEAKALPVFTDPIIEFVKRSRRFNAIVFVWEEVLPFLRGGFPTMSLRACFNDRPRHNFEPRNMFEMRQVNDELRMARSFLNAIKTRRQKVSA